MSNTLVDAQPGLPVTGLAPAHGRTPTQRALYVGLGTISLGLGIVGAFLPVMPTTVFILIAAWCFARGSERYYNRLLAHRVFGPLVHDWQRHRAIPTRARRVAITMIIASFSLSIYVVPMLWVRCLLVACAGALIVFLVRLPSRESVLGHVSA
jgi:uncharacterized membrane protein YbaN (DUF454 family)